jgi:hypothetical protein
VNSLFELASNPLHPSLASLVATITGQAWATGTQLSEPGNSKLFFCNLIPRSNLSSPWILDFKVAGILFSLLKLLVKNSF